MRLPEQRLWDSFRRNSIGYKIVLMRVENICDPGFPDIITNSNGHINLIELKVAKLPKRETTRVLGNNGLDKDQIAWHRLWNSINGRSYILIRDNAKGLYLIPGSFAAEVNNMNINQLCESRIADNWKSIFEFLTRHSE